MSKTPKGELPADDEAVAKVPACPDADRRKAAQTQKRSAARFSSKPATIQHPENDHHFNQTEETGLHRYVGTLSPNQVKVTNRRIRDPYVRWCERHTPLNPGWSRLLD